MVLKPTKFSILEHRDGKKTQMHGDMVLPVHRFHDLISLTTDLHENEIRIRFPKTMLSSTGPKI